MSVECETSNLNPGHQEVGLGKLAFSSTGLHAWPSQGSPESMSSTGLWLHFPTCLQALK